MTRSRDDYLPPLTGLRGIAAAWVTGFHLWLFAGQPLIGALFACGYFGVDLFFVLSGLLLGHQFARARKEGRQVHLGRFFAHRLRRVLPALWVQIVLLLGLAFWLGRQTPGLVDLLGHLSLTFNLWRNDSALNPVYWSLPVEWDFYLLLPLLAVVFRSRGWLLGGALFVLGLSITVRFACVAALRTWGGEEGVEAYRWIIQLPARLDQFLAGMVVAWHLVHGRRRGALVAALVGFALVALAAWRAVAYSDLVVEVGTPWLYVHFSVLAVGFALLAYAAVTAPRGVLGRTLSGRALAWLGTISYSLYLWHYPVLELLHPLLAPTVGADLAALALLPLVLGVSWLSYRFVERPFLGQRARRSEQHAAGRRGAEAQPSVSE